MFGAQHIPTLPVIRRDDDTDGDVHHNGLCPEKIGRRSRISTTLASLPRWALMLLSRGSTSRHATYAGTARRSCKR